MAKVRLSDEEKDHIDMIAASLGKESKDVKDVFLALISYVTLNMYQGKDEFVIPYFGKVKVKAKKVVVPKGFELREECSVQTSPAFHNIVSKIQTGEKTWIEDFCISALKNNIGEKLGIQA